MKHLLIFIMIATVFCNCRKIDKHQVPTILPQPFSDVKVKASVQGIVLNENKEPIANAPISSGTNIVNTNPKGYFFFDDIQISRLAGAVTVDIPGYFKATRTLMVKEGSVNFVTIQLISKTLKGVFRSGTGGIVNVEQGSSVKFDANTVVTASGKTSYSGDVNLLGTYIDPTDPELLSVMPGNLMGLEPDNNLKLLQTFGMMAIEMRGSTGETLELAAGKTATISMPIPASLLAQAPATIPLWHFDDTTGLWKKEGTANKEGNMYVGKVSHFSFWNLDIPNEFVTVSMKFAFQGGYSFPFHEVRMTNLQNGCYSAGFTNADGVVEGGVPVNTKILREVFNYCHQKIASDEIGPFTSSVDLGTTVIAIPGSTLVNITGSAKNCGGGKLTNGYADIFLDGGYYRTNISDGNYSISIARCDNTPATAYISATDIDEGLEGDPFPVAIESGSYNIGTITACGYSIRQYLDITLDDSIHFSFAEPADSFVLRLVSADSYISAFRKNQPGINFKVIFYPDILPAVCDILSVTMNTGDSLVNATGGPLSMNEGGPRHDFILGEIKVRLRDLTFTDQYEAKIKYKVRRN